MSQLKRATGFGAVLLILIGTGGCLGTEFGSLERPEIPAVEEGLELFLGENQDADYASLMGLILPKAHANNGAVIVGCMVATTLVSMDGVEARYDQTPTWAQLSGSAARIFANADVRGRFQEARIHFEPECRDMGHSFFVYNGLHRHATRMSTADSIVATFEGRYGVRGGVAQYLLETSAFLDIAVEISTAAQIQRAMEGVQGEVQQYQAF